MLRSLFDCLQFISFDLKKIMNIKLYTIILSVLMLLLSGCGPSEKEREMEAELKRLKAEEQARLDEQAKQFKLNGSVFITTRGGTNYKLGLAPVAALTNDEFQTVEAISNEAVTAFYDENIEPYKKAKEELTFWAEKLKPIKADYDEAYSAYKAIVESYEYGGSKYHSTVSLYHSSGEVSAYDHNNGHSIGRQAIREINDAITKVNDIVKKYEAMRRQTEVYEAVMDKAARESRTMVNGYQRTLSMVSLIFDVPKTKTNADGEFSLNLMRGIDYVIVSYQDRRVGDSSEEYNWFVPYSTPLVQAEDTLLISNNTLADATSVATNALSVFEAAPYIRILSELDPYKLNLE